MRLSKNFVLSEITRSNTARRLGIKNEPTKKHMEGLQRIISNLVQPMRDALGPIRITSGYRSPELNRAIGGSSTKVKLWTCSFGKMAKCVIKKFMTGFYNQD